MSFKIIDSPLGPMHAFADDNGLAYLEFSDRGIPGTESGDLAARLKLEIIPGKNKYLEQAERELAEYFSGKRKSFGIKLNMTGTPFQLAAWNELLTIPYGSTRSYRQQASAVNNPLAVRAVARANGMNRIAIVVPCHRVIGDNGKLTGYGGGLWRKEFLLDLESGVRKLEY